LSKRKICRKTVDRDGRWLRDITKEKRSLLKRKETFFLNEK